MISKTSSPKKIMAVLLVLVFIGFTESSALSQGNSNTVEVGGKTLKLIGRGVREFLFIDIYKMAVYSESGSCNPSNIIKKNETKAIRLSMVRKIPATRMNDTLRDSLLGNMEDKNDEEMKKTIESFLSFFKGDLVSGTFIEILYIPGKGTVVKQNGKKLGVTPGRPFHELLWKSYFGKDTCCTDLKSSIISACNAS